MPNVSNATWAGQRLLCLTIPPSAKMETICTSLPLNLYKTINFSERGWTLITQKHSSKRRQRPLLFVSATSHDGKRAENTGPGAPSSPSCLSGCHQTHSLWVHLVRAMRSPSLVWARQPSAASRCTGERHRGFTEQEVGKSSPLRAAAFDPITAADSRMRQEKAKLQFVTADLVLDSN